MKTIPVCLYSVAMLMLAGGCVRSLNPLVGPDDRTFDPALVGTWTEGDGDESWAFTQAGDDQYRLVYTDAQGRAAPFDAALTTLGEDRFLQFAPADLPENPNDFYQWHVLPTCSFVRIRQIEPELQMQFPDADWLKDQLTASPGALEHAYIGDELILTAPTAGLRTFWQAHARTPGAFEDPSHLTKRPTAEKGPGG